MSNFNPLDFIANHAGMNIADAIKEAYEQGKKDAQERKTGHWHDRYYSDITKIVCSECQHEFSYDADTGESDYNYCPNCGTDMRRRKNV